MTEDRACFIAGEWTEGSGVMLRSENPVDRSVVWEAPSAARSDVDRALEAARHAQTSWSRLTVDERRVILERFADLVASDPWRLADVISLETGKPAWEALTEANALRGKVALSIAAQIERTGDQVVGTTGSLTYRALGVVGVIGPFNFPAHLANGQIVPALLAGNSVVYKPSELTPLVAKVHTELLAEAGVPAGVLNLVIGGRDAGEALVAGAVDAIAFTGSVAAGRAIHRSLAGRPDVLLALEMGGNNPLVVADVPDLDAAVNILIRSAFITAGQRCTCARRIYIPNTAAGDRLLDAFVDATDRLRVGAPTEDPEPFLGPVISEAAADRVRSHIAQLENLGATRLTRPDDRGGAFVRPAIVEATGVELADDEVFGPVVSVHRFDDLDLAFEAAADTSYGLAAGLITSDPTDFDRYQQVIKAGVVNLNCPTTGASGRLPFGGIGASGNHRPAGFAAADFVASPVARMVYSSPTEAVAPIVGLEE